MVLMRTVYSQTQGCVSTAIQLGGDVEQPWLMSKYDNNNNNNNNNHLTAVGKPG